MSEKKAICSNPECGNDDVSDNVKNYSLDNYGVILCYPCQELVRSGKLDVEALKETLKKKGMREEENKGTLDSFGGDAKESDEALEEYDREVGAKLEVEEKELNAKIKELVTSLTLPDKDKFFVRLDLIYGVKQIDDLHLQDKRKVLEEEEEARRLDKMSEGKVIEGEVVDDKKPEPERHHTVEIDEGTFSFEDGPDGVLLCKNGVSDKVYELRVETPECSCRDFTINKKKHEWCKHLKAAAILKYPVKELPKVPEVLDKALAKEDKVGARRGKPKKEEVIALTVMGQEIEMAVQTPVEVIQNEEMAAKMIKDIVGPKPEFKDVIEKFGDIEEVSADMIISVAQYAGIRFQILSKEIETTKMNLGKIFQVIPMKEDKKKYYEGVAGFMPDTDVVVRCKITSVAAWKDKAGNLRVGMGTKEEHLTPYELKDIVMRGANFIETKCESKAFKKSILNALPVTHDGLLQKIKATYGW